MARLLGCALLGVVVGATACQAQDACPPEMVRASAAQGDLTTIQNCLAEGADVDAPSEDGVTALMLAAARAQLDMVAALVEAGADVDATTSDGVTPLMVAAAWGQLVSVRTLVRQGDADVTIEDAGGWTAIDWVSAAPYTTGDNVVAIMQFLQSPRVGGERGSGAGAADWPPDLAAILERAEGARPEN